MNEEKAFITFLMSQVNLLNGLSLSDHHFGFAANFQIVGEGGATVYEVPMEGRTWWVSVKTE